MLRSNFSLTGSSFCDVIYERPQVDFRRVNTNKLDLTGKQQHGFKRNKSTATAGALLQSLIARAADENCYVVMASLDLSMAFDMVNVPCVQELRLFFLFLHQ